MTKTFDLKTAQSMILSTAYKAVKSVGKFIDPKSSWVPVSSIPGAFGDAITEMPGKAGDGKLWFVVGKDTMTQTIAYECLEDMPHLLVAGTTGSGKSVFLNGLLASLLVRHTAKDLLIGLVDPKKVEFAIYGNLPHLFNGTIREDIQGAADMMEYGVLEMERRLDLFKKSTLEGVTVKSLSDYNKLCAKEGEKLPRIVLVVDEFADLILGSKTDKESKEYGARFETAITRLAQKARAAGIHLVLSTQKPIEKVITSLLKGNMPSRVAFQVMTPKESEVILDVSGLANKLTGCGDMYFRPKSKEMFRLKGLWVSDDDIRTVVEGG